MGWQTHDGKEMGDEPLDLMSDCIDRIARSYIEELGRSPTLDEVLECVRHALNVRGRGAIPQLDRLEVTRVTLKTKKLPKTQKFEIGDCFAIGLDREFAYGRILRETSAGRLVEIYDLRTSKVLPFAEFRRRKKRVAWQKHVNGIRAFRDRRWLIIGREEIPARYNYAPFYTGSPFIGFVIARGDKELRASKLPIGTDAEPLIMFSPDTIETRITANTPDPWPEVEQVRRRDDGE